MNQITRPTGIIRTLPSLYHDEGNIGYSRYTRSIEELEKEIIPAIYIALAQMPKIEVLYMYLLIEGQIRVRLNIVEYVPGTAEICWDSTIRQPKYWAVCSGPVSRPPETIVRKGFHCSLESTWRSSRPIHAGQPITVRLQHSLFTSDQKRALAPIISTG